MNRFGILLQNYEKVTRCDMSKCCWENGTDKLKAGLLPQTFVKKKAISVKANKMRCACADSEHQRAVLPAGAQTG